MILGCTSRTYTAMTTTICQTMSDKSNVTLRIREKSWEREDIFCYQIIQESWVCIKKEKIYDIIPRLKKKIKTLQH